MLPVSPQDVCQQYVEREGTGSWQGFSDKVALSTNIWAGR